jgi:hypothetical protein
VSLASRPAKFGFLRLGGRSRLNVDSKSLKKLCRKNAYVKDDGDTGKLRVYVRFSAHDFARNGLQVDLWIL